MKRSIAATSLALASILLVSAASARAADPIFNPAVLHEIRVVMDPADWKALQDNFRSNQYYAANSSIDGEVLQQIGVRSAGKGSRSDVKPYLKLDFNHYVKGQRFHGLKSVRVKNLVQDQSMLRDYLAMAVFEAMGIPAPAYGFARLTVNDEYWGVFNIVEAVEEPFLASRFGEDNGNLFKYEYAAPWYFTVRGGDGSAYIPDPFKAETNETTLDPAPLVAMVQTANESADGTLVADLSKYMDVDRMLAYVATENALAESDGFLGSEGMNNFYFYQPSGQTKFVIIPWDKNTSFQSPTWPILRNVDPNVLIRRLLANADKKAVYTAAAKRASSNYVNTAFLGPKLEAAYGLIRSSVLTDTKKPYSNDDFELAVSGLRGIVAGRSADVAAQVP